MSYPCHVCAATMIHGQTYEFPRKYDPAKPSCGKVYVNPSLTATAVMGGTSEWKLMDCYRCKGTGWLNERRQYTRRGIPERRDR